MLLGAKARSPSAVNEAAQISAAKHADCLNSILESLYILHMQVLGSGTHPQSGEQPLRRVASAWCHAVMTAH